MGISEKVINMSEKLKRFTDLMQQIFELDKSDLDFGIYRIMNIRKAEIEKFLNERLPEMVAETLRPFAQGSRDAIRAEMAQIEQDVSEMGMTVASLPESATKKQKYILLQKQLAEGADLSALETDVYSALYNFFNRYYEEGDFISKRRYKEGVYAIPYEGEEVKLYWANQDQYYIKTSENFKDYTFVVGDYTVHFRLVDATTEQNNNKESADSKRVFMLFTEDEENYPGVRTFEYDADGKELIIRFVFDIPEDKKKKWAEANYDAIVTWLVANRPPMWQELLAQVNTGKGKDKNQKDLLRKHLDAYVAKNTFDYFIHKDLRGFLTRELDFYIKSEIMHLDDLDTENEARVETWLAKVKAVKRVGAVIIDFLAQIEDFQKKLWLKKKFVVETNWCMTLDKVDEAFWPEILANRAQIDEWIAMYAIDEAEGWTNPPSPDFLRKNLNLIIDTKHFNDDFKARLVASIDGLDEQTNGLMINGDNFHALTALTSRYKGQVRYTYIDPPYNAQSSEILYKNTFKHAAWLSMMDNRLSASLQLLRDDAVYTIAIDEVENYRLGMLTEELLQQFTGHTDISVIINPSGQQGKNFSTTNEYLHFYYHDETGMLAKEIRTEDNADVRGFMNGAKGESGNYLRTSGKTCFYPIYVKNGLIIGFGDVCSDEYHPSSANIEKDDCIEIYPIDSEGVERKWLFGRDTVESIQSELSIKTNRNTGLLEVIRTKSEINYKTVWTDNKYSAKENGTNLLSKLFGTSPFSFPKSLYAVQECVAIACRKHSDSMILDFFAGSGTTAHAVIALNREDNGNRKYILAEMGEYFSAVTKPRVQKVVYATDWKNGKPLSRNTGISQIIKYLRLESYEDALSNIRLKDDTQGLMGLFGEEYLIRYMLDLESRDSLLDLEAFRDPFAYRMKITEKNECKERPVDLIETFNYLIGLTVTRQGAVSCFSARPAAAPAYEGAVELSKDPSGAYAFRQVEGTLPDGRRALVIWRTVTDDLRQSNAALDAYFTKYRINPTDREYDVIYVNGDSNLENLRTPNESWKVQMTELEFKKRMFEEG